MGNVLVILRDQLGDNEISEEYHKKEYGTTDRKRIHSLKRLMDCKGLVINQIVKQCKYDLRYVNPVLIKLQNMKYIDTFREQPNQKTKNDIDDALQRKEKLQKKKKLDPEDKYELEQIEKILKKKNEDKNDLYVYLTEHGENQIRKYEEEAKSGSDLLKIVDNWIKTRKLADPADLVFWKNYDVEDSEET